jgi:hypothetical protein
MRKKIKLISDGGDSGSKKCNRDFDGAYSGVWRSLLLVGSLESGGRFCVGAFGRNVASVAVKMCSRLIYFVRKFYKFYTFNAICKGNAATKSITALVMEAASTSETSVNFYQTTRRYNPKDSHLHTRRCENLKSYSLVEIYRRFKGACYFHHQGSSVNFY